MKKLAHSVTDGDAREQEAIIVVDAEMIKKPDDSNSNNDNVDTDTDTDCDKDSAIRNGRCGSSPQPTSTTSLRKSVLRKAFWLNTWVLLGMAATHQQQLGQCHATAAPPSSATNPTATTATSTTTTTVPSGPTPASSSDPASVLHPPGLVVHHHDGDARFVDQETPSSPPSLRPEQHGRHQVSEKDGSLTNHDELSFTEESMDIEEYQNFRWDCSNDSDTDSAASSPTGSNNNSNDNDDNDNDKRNNHNTSSSKCNPNSDVIVVTTVDGTMAGLSKSDGRLMWKNNAIRTSMATESPVRWQQQPANGGRGNTLNNQGVENSQLERGKSRLLSPLVSTTTKSSSSGQDWRTAAVPSVDGRVFLTAGRESHHHQHQRSSGDRDVTATSTVKELVARAPYMDTRGWWYVGSRMASAAAIDRNTGDILTVVSDGNMANQKVSMEDRDVVWVGRVDYSVTLFNQQGIVDVEFSSSEVMSANDMAEAGLMGELETSLDKPDDPSMAASQQHAPRLMLPDALEPDHTSMLVATPGGNVAFRNAETGSIEWVSNERFDTPVAFAVESASGLSLGVDIIPDAPVPNSSQDYLSRELERQVALLAESSTQDQTIFGALNTGQLFAMPLGQRLSKISAKPSSLTLGLPHHQSSTTSSISASSKALTKVQPLAGQSRHGFDLHGTTNTDEQQKTLVPQKSCQPSSETFPGCLVGGIHSSDNFASGKSFLDKTDDSGTDAGGVGPFDYNNPFMFPHPQHQQHGFGPKHNPFHRKKKQKAFNKLMSSWLPPTILLLLSVGFQVGRHFKETNRKKKEEEADATQAETDADTKTENQVGVIQVTDEVLGFGGHGTVVYKGTLDGRRVAVKRMLKAYHASADREISLLIESDGHPNVVRYFLKELRGDFVYLALELCDMSLLDLIVTLRQRSTDKGLLTNTNDSESEADSSLPLLTRESSVTTATTVATSTTDGLPTVSPAIPDVTKHTLLQIATGVRHLHSLRIVHRDLKPANILLARNRKAVTQAAVAGGIDENDRPNDIDSVMAAYERGDYVAKISDMGLGKQLAGQSSFGVSTLGNSSLHGHSNNGGTNVAAGPGSVGWQAPEVMAIRWSSETGTSDAASRLGDSISEMSPLDLAMSTRTSRSVDIFSLGCIFHCVLIPGCHPFGEWFEREANIMRDNVSLDALRAASIEGYDLVSSMLHRNPVARPTAKQDCDHPFFWSDERKLAFLCDLSDKIESDYQALEDGDLSQSSFGTCIVAVERNAAAVVGTAWDKELDPDLLTNVAKFRTYDPSSVRDCLRLIRNKHHHYDELPPEVKARIGGLFQYFQSKFPKLLLHCYSLCRDFLPDDDKLVVQYSIPLRQDMNSGKSRDKLLLLSAKAAQNLHNENIPEAAPIRAVDAPKAIETIVDDAKMKRNDNVRADDGPDGDQVDAATPPSTDDSDELVPCDESAEAKPTEEAVVNGKQHDVHIIDDPVGGDGDRDGDGDGDGDTKVDTTCEPTSVSEQTEQTKLDEDPSDAKVAIMPDTAAPDTLSVDDAAKKEPSPPVQSIAPGTPTATTTIATPTTTTPSPPPADTLDDIVVWEGSTTAKTLNCRGWMRSDDEWTRKTSLRKRDSNVMRCATDGKFRTRLCNHWDASHGTFCPMRKKNKCVFAHGPAELRVKEGKKHRWGKLVDRNGDNSNPNHSGGEDTYGAARSIETIRKVEGKWNIEKGGGGGGGRGSGGRGSSGGRGGGNSGRGRQNSKSKQSNTKQSKPKPKVAAVQS